MGDATEQRQELLRTGRKLARGLDRLSEQLGVFGASGDRIARLREQIARFLRMAGEDPAVRVDEGEETLCAMHELAIMALSVMSPCLRDNGRDLRQRFDETERLPFSQCHALASALAVLARALLASSRLPRWTALHEATRTLVAESSAWMELARGMDAAITSSLSGPLSGAVRSPLAVSLGDVAHNVAALLPTFRQIQVDIETLLVAEAPDMANLLGGGRKQRAYLFGVLFDCLAALRTPALSWQSPAFEEKERLEFLDDGGAADESWEAPLKRFGRAADHWRRRGPHSCVKQDWERGPMGARALVPVVFQEASARTLKLFYVGDYLASLTRPP